MSVETFRKLQLNARASREDLLKFIAEHADAKKDSVVEVNCVGIGECWADRLEEAGFTVKRSYEFPLPESSKSSDSSVSSVSSKISA